MNKDFTGANMYLNLAAFMRKIISVEKKFLLFVNNFKAFILVESLKENITIRGKPQPIFHIFRAK